MITIISGDVGSGKTALMTYFAVNHMTVLSFDDVFSSKQEVKRLNKGGFTLSLPKKHIVYADYDITSGLNKYPRRSSYEVDGFFLGLPNTRQDTIFVPPCSKIFLDEAQKYYNSRRTAIFPDFVSRFYETHRHYKLDIYLACQRSGLIDLNIREIGQRFIEVLELTHKYNNYGQIKKTIWKCIEFYNYFEFENYLNSGKQKGGNIVKYVFEGNIFSCYDSHNFMALHLKNRYENDFDMTTSQSVGYDLEAIKEYNGTHNYEVPSTFYDEKKR